MDKHRRGIGGLYLVVAVYSFLGAILEITNTQNPGCAPTVFIAQAVLFVVLGMQQFSKHS